jgi:predicted DNA-binding protein
MTKFQREQRPARSRMVTIRMTDEQIATLEGVASAIGITGGKAEAIRRAIDFWIENDREARAAANRLRRK